MSVVLSKSNAEWWFLAVKSFPEHKQVGGLPNHGFQTHRAQIKFNLLNKNFTVRYKELKRIQVQGTKIHWGDSLQYNKAQEDNPYT